MKKLRKWLFAILILVILVGIAIIAVGGAFLDFIPFPGKQEFSRPPCDKLPSKEVVEEAYAKHGELVDRLRSVGPNVKVEVVTPCRDYPNNAVIRISFKTNAEKEGISSILSKEGFGAPVELVRR
ncbi:MAG: hypothetical protein IMX03_07440 [Brockia lithotrophica]|nr:hypothetical protein [Brockia lithotrophica]